MPKTKSFPYSKRRCGCFPLFRMKIVPEYKNSAFVVPTSVTEYLKEADKDALSFILFALSKIEFTESEAKAALGLDKKALHKAVSFWTERSILSCDGGAGAKHVAKKTTKRTSSLPTLTTEETAQFLENNGKTAELIDTCENIIGKIFTTAETNVVIGLLDHLSLSEDYILLLFAHAAKNGKHSVRYIETMALSLVDRDITTYKELEAELLNIDLAESTLREVRRMFGIGRRAFSDKEKNMVYNWCVKWSYGADVIGKAYEITVNSTGEASLSYANAILNKWHAEKLTTIEEVNAYVEAENAKRGPKNTGAPSTSSFETDGFFESALLRSYGEDK